MDPEPRRATATDVVSGWLEAAVAGDRPDRLTWLLAVAAAVLTLVVVARGLTFSQSGGILRLAPYATLLLGPFVAALAVLRPWTGLVAWVVLMPALNIARVAVLVGAVQVILPTLLIAALAIGLWRSGGLTRAWSAGRAARLAYAGAALLVALALLALAAGTAPFTRSVPIALHGMIEPVLLVAIALALRPSWRASAALAVAMGVSVALASIFNLVRIVVVRDQLTSTDEMRIQLARLTYYNVGMYGDMLSIAIPLLIGALLMRRALRATRWGTLLLALGLAVSIVGLYMTLTKSGWLGAAAGSLALLLFIAPSWRMRIGVVVLGAVLAAAVVPYPAYVLRHISPDLANAYERIASVVNSRSSTIDPSTPEGEVSVTERLYATTAALRMSLDHPLVGVGPGGFAAEYKAHYRPATSTRALDSAHDLVPYVAAEFGLPAGALVGLALVGAILLAWLAAQRADPADGLARILPLSVAAALIGFVVVSTTFGVDLYRDYRMVSSDVLFAGLLVALAFASWELSSAGRPRGAEVAA